MAADASPGLSLQARFPQWVIARAPYRGQEIIYLRREGLLEAARFLRDDPVTRLDVLMDLSCVDYLTFGTALRSAPRLATPAPLPYYMEPKRSPEAWARPVSREEYRFDLVYHLFSSAAYHRLRVKVPLTAADPAAPSLTPLWAGANWFEREVWDMFGIRFTGHPELRRILLYEEFKGHPLRKDYPIRKRQPLIGPAN